MNTSDLASRFTPPSGGRVFALDVTEIDLRKAWHESMRGAGDPLPTSALRYMADSYPPTNEYSDQEQHVLVNTARGEGWIQAMVWAQTNGLKLNDPRRVWRMAEQHPKLHEQLGAKDSEILLRVISTTQVERQYTQITTGVWWEDVTGRLSDPRKGVVLTPFVERIENFGILYPGQEYDWYSFRI